MGGFNIPGHILNPFYAGKFDPLTRREERFLREFEEMRGKRFYIIGTAQAGHKDTLLHEIAHGLFYTNASYRREAIAALDGFTRQDREKIDAFLEGLTHHPESWVDETHAYALAGRGQLERIGVNKRRLYRVYEHLKSIFRKHRNL